MEFTRFSFSEYIEIKFIHSDVKLFSIELQEALRLFFIEQIQTSADETTQLAVEPLINGQIEFQTLLDQWFKLVQVGK
jgi:hypothetical protein